MKQESTLKLFISYCHKDEEHIQDFITQIAPLKRKKLISEWYDRKIIAGDHFQDDIDKNLNNSDIICLFISPSFLASGACNHEIDYAMKLRENKGIAVVTVILAPCGWLDDSRLATHLAVQTDGKPIIDFKTKEEGWQNVYDGLKKVVEKQNVLNEICINEEFKTFLQDTDLLKNAHSKKEQILLDDIFVYPQLTKFDSLKEFDSKICASEIPQKIFEFKKILIAGENQSGKTALCKQFFQSLWDIHYFPVYVSDENSKYEGRIEKKISEAFRMQYSGVKDIVDVPKNRIVPIIDNFHFAKNKEKHIANLTKYSFNIIIVDDLFSLNIKDEGLIKSYVHFKMNEFAPSKRNELIEKWILLSDISGNDENQKYQRLDYETEIVNTTLGKVLGNGIMPAYPFFVLTIISSYETVTKPLDQEITSQGYCYQSLIYMYLRKEGVGNDEIDIYINFLTELAFHFYRSKIRCIGVDGLEHFIHEYTEKFNLPIKKEVLLRKLRNTQILRLDSFNNYSYIHNYLFYKVPLREY